MLTILNALWGYESSEALSLHEWLTYLALPFLLLYHYSLAPLFLEAKFSWMLRPCTFVSLCWFLLYISRDFCPFQYASWTVVSEVYRYFMTDRVRCMAGHCSGLMSRGNSLRCSGCRGNRFCKGSPGSKRGVYGFCTNSVKSRRGGFGCWTDS